MVDTWLPVLVALLIGIWVVRHEVRFATLHGKRAVVLDRLYLKLLAARDAIDAVTSGGAPQLDHAQQRVKGLRTYLERRRPWLPRRLLRDLEPVLELLEAAAVDSMILMSYSPEQGAREPQKEARRALDEELPNLLRWIEAYLQWMLGESRWPFPPRPPAVSYSREGSPLHHQRAGPATYLARVGEGPAEKP